MTAQKGSIMLLKAGTASGGTTVAGLISTAIKIKNELIDVTTKDSSGWRALLAGGIQQATIVVSGLAVSDAGYVTLQGYAWAASINTLGMIFGNGDTADGSWLVSDWEVSGELKEQKFTCTLESAGPITFVNV